MVSVTVAGAGRPAPERTGVGAPRAGWSAPHWRLGGMLALLVSVQALSLAGVLAGATWWVLMIGVGWGVLGCAAAARSLGAPRAAVPAITVGAIVAGMTAAFGAGTGVFGIVPTPASLGVFSRLFVGGLESIAVQSVPAEPVEALLFLIVGGAALCAFAFDVLAVTLRMPALCGIPVLFVIGIPAIFLPDGVSPWSLVYCMVAYLLLLRMDVVIRRGGFQSHASAGPSRLRGVMMAAIAIVVALVIGLTAPGFSAGGAVGANSGGIQFAYGVNPLIDLGKDLRRPKAVTALTYTTTTTGGEYLKLTTLDRFTGKTWIHGATSHRSRPLSQGLGPVPGLAPGTKTTTARTVVSIGAMQSPWLPVPYPATQVSGLTGNWFVAPEDLTVNSVNSAAHGQQYRVTSLKVAPTPGQLRAAGPVPPSVSDDLEVPRNMPRIILDTAAKVTADADDHFQQAVALQAYFRSALFQYSLDAPVRDGYDGDSADVIATFLKVRRGYCVHFAAAMALMARSLGIPARIAVGYLPGSTTGSSPPAEADYTVSSDDLHSWPELYFPGAGWIPFEPTASRGVLPDYTLTDVTTAPADVTEQTPSAAPAPAVPKDKNSAAETLASGPGDSGRVGLQITLWVFIALSLGLLPAISRQTIRRRRLRQLSDGVSGSVVAWREITDTARDLRFGPGPAETPRAFSERLRQRASMTESESSALARILHAVELDRYGPPRRIRNPAAALAKDTTVVAAALHRAVDRPSRLAAFFAPLSLMPTSTQRTLRTLT
ncbi:MAG: DUF3488 and transglutaminase-like domain-containing protein [Microbacteriaceae bacterium]